jgi:TolA-binding protein
MKKTYRHLLFGTLLASFSCQKEYTSEDLNRLENSILELKFNLYELENENTSLIYRNTDLRNQISDLKDRISQIQNQNSIWETEMELFLNQIEILEFEIEKLNGVESNMYQVVSIKREYIDESISKDHPNSYLFFEKWFDTTQNFYSYENQVENPADYLFLKDSSVQSVIKFKAYQMAESNTYQNQKLYPIKRDLFEYYPEESLSSREFIDIKYLHKDTVLLIEKIRSLQKFSLNGGQTLFYEVYNPVYTDKIEYKKLIPVEEISYYTDEELAEEFRNLGLGFYSDELYASLDSNNLLDYTRVFIEDGKRYGLDLSYILNEEPHLELNESVLTESGFAIARASEKCTPEKIWIEFTKSKWLENGILQPFQASRLKSMYHELGHTVFGYKHHIHSESGHVLSGFGQGIHDIMGYTTENHFYKGGENRNNQDTWAKRVERFFKGVNHEYFDCTLSGKEKTPFYCSQLNQ